MVTTKDILDKYSKKIEASLDSPRSSQEYRQLKQEMIPTQSKYEHWAKALGNIIKINVAEKDRLRIQKHLETAHLDVSPSQALTLAVISMLLVFFGTLIIGMGIYFLSKSPNVSVSLISFVFLGFIASIFIFYYAYTMPQRLANAWRLQASSQMVPAILYMVVYMKHTSNLERAVEFASQHLEGPLALDFK